MIRLAPATAIVVLMSTAPMAQSAPSQPGPSARFMTAVPVNGTTVTNYYKQSVYDPSGNKVGDVSDLIVEKDGRITTAMVGVGGFLGIDEKNVAIPFDALKASRKNNVWHLTVNTTKDELKRAPGFRYDRDTTMWVSDKSASNAQHKSSSLPSGGTMSRE